MQMTETPGFNVEFWLAIATIAPVLLVAFAATFEPLLTRNRETANLRRPRDRRWANLWMNAVPWLGGLLTALSVLMLATRWASQIPEIVAGLAMLCLLVGIISSGITLISLRTRFPPGEEWTSEV